MADVVYVTSRSFTIDDIIYPIGVYRSDFGYMAFCDCHRCHSYNMQAKAAADQNAAIQECETLIRQHHAEWHPANS